MEDTGGDNKNRVIGQEWKYETHLKEYLLLLASKKRFGLESVRNFPQRIELGKTWHETLNQMRKDSRDGIERWAFVGFGEDKRRLLFPTVVAEGVSDHVPAKVIQEKLKITKSRSGLIDLIGDLHSHPKDFMVKSDSLAGSISQALDAVREKWTEFKGESNIIFSPGDFYRMVMPESLFPAMGVVQGNNNLFAFKTRESVDIPVPSRFFDQSSFTKYWLDTIGFRPLNERMTEVEAIRPGASIWKMNLAIAQKHNLVLYKGRPDQNLHKVFP